MLQVLLVSLVLDFFVCVDYLQDWCHVCSFPLLVVVFVLIYSETRGAVILRIQEVLLLFFLFLVVTYDEMT